MRNFEERKAEVFRRSENRIKERKRNRNRILALSIPLCLILTMWARGIMPAILPVKKNDIKQENTFDILLGIGESFESVVITETDGEGSQTETVTDVDKVNEIRHAVLDLYGDGNGETFVEDSEVLRDEVKGEDFTRENLSENIEYTICFKSTDGYEISYVLNNYELCNENTGNRIELSKVQREELLEILELTD